MALATSPGMAAEPVGHRHHKRSAEQEDSVCGLSVTVAQRPRPSHQAVLVVVTHRPDMAQRGHGNVHHRDDASRQRGLPHATKAECWLRPRYALPDLAHLDRARMDDLDT